jgi:hypothetical protein
MSKLKSIATTDKPLLISDEAMQALGQAATIDALREAAKLDLEVSGYVGDRYTKMRARDLLEAMSKAKHKPAVA